jgi:hypothetical protein
MKTAARKHPANLIPLPHRATRTRPEAIVSGRFKVIPFTNRAGSLSWRVSGNNRDGTRVRENFSREAGARCRQIELETEFLRGHTETVIRETKLTAEQLQLAEVACIKLGDGWQHILDAVDHWKRHGKHRAVGESPRIDDAVTQYLTWLDASPFRDATKRLWKFRMAVFKNSVPNLRVADVTPETIEEFLAKQIVSPVGKDTYRRAAARFFSWCIERPRRWATTNPCRELKVQQAEQESAPEILTVKECKRMLRAAQEHKGGLQAPGQ